MANPVHESPFSKRASTGYLTGWASPYALSNDPIFHNAGTTDLLLRPVLLFCSVLGSCYTRGCVAPTDSALCMLSCGNRTTKMQSPSLRTVQNLYISESWALDSALLQDACSWDGTLFDERAENGRWWDWDWICFHRLYQMLMQSLVVRLSVLCFGTRVVSVEVHCIKENLFHTRGGTVVCRRGCAEKCGNVTAVGSSSFLVKAMQFTQRYLSTFVDLSNGRRIVHHQVQDALACRIDQKGSLLCSELKPSLIVGVHDAESPRSRLLLTLIENDDENIWALNAKLFHLDLPLIRWRATTTQEAGRNLVCNNVYHSGSQEGRTVLFSECCAEMHHRIYNCNTQRIATHNTGNRICKATQLGRFRFRDWAAIVWREAV